MVSELMLIPREKSPLLEKFSPEEYQTHNAAASWTTSPTHYLQAIPAPGLPLRAGKHGQLFNVQIVLKGMLLLKLLLI